MVFLVYETLGEYLTDLALSDGMEDQITKWVYNDYEVCLSFMLFPQI